jgi:hypothetical protein
MTDPWTLHSELSCPSCHVKGKVVTNSADEDNDYYQGHEAPYTCVDCGSACLHDLHYNWGYDAVFPIEVDK